MAYKIAIVTGASGNMGQVVIKKFLGEGYLVIGTIVQNDPTPLDIQDKRFEKVVVDLTDEEDASNFITAMIEKHKRIDVLVTTVGGFAMGSIAETKTSDILKQYKLNFETAYNVARPVFMQMRKQQTGRIFLVGSRPGLDAKSGMGMIAYGLGKSLIFRLAELMNEECKEHNVVTSVLVPGTIDTLQNRNAMPGANFNNWIKAEAIADAILFYCSDTAMAIREPVIKLYNNS